MILWDRDGDKFFKTGLSATKKQYKMVVTFKNNRVSITVHYMGKRKHDSFYLRYKEIPHLGCLDKAVDMMISLMNECEHEN